MSGKYDFRDVSTLLKKLREFLLGRRHTLHGRFPPMMATRSIPPPDIPRGPDDCFSNKYYYQRSAADSVKPPVVAPIAEGPPANLSCTKKAESGGMNPSSVCFTNAPTPGESWWWDGHCYFCSVPDTPADPCAPCLPSPPPPCPPCPPPSCPPPC